MFDQLFSQSQLQSQRKQEIQKIIGSKGFPTKKDENWKYTSLKTWVEKNYALATAENAEIKVTSQDTYPIVFVNGQFRQDLSQVPNKIIIQHQEENELPKDSLAAVGSLAAPKKLNFHFEEESQFDRPIELIFISASQANEAVAGFRLSVSVGASASVSFIENHIQMGESTLFIYNECEYKIQKNAKVEFLQTQSVNLKSLHLSRLHFQLEANAFLRTCVISRGAKQSRSELNVDFNQPAGDAETLGIYSIDQDQQSDHYTNIRHHVGHCNSSQLYKGLLAGKSKAVFVGGVYIAKDAQKANSEQLNKNLLMSAEAEINSKPELQIHADDVKAAHGSTIGQLQKEELFYLQSRGIRKQKALEILSQAFVSDVVYRLESETLRNHAKRSLL